MKNGQAEDEVIPTKRLWCGASSKKIDGREDCPVGGFSRY
jgi:hypothetical protein